MMMKIMTNTRGFTLVEIIAVLLLAGILAAVTGHLLVTSVRSYALVKQSADVAQKAQLTLKRIRLELENISDVRTASMTALHYRISPDGENEQERTLGLDGRNLRLGSGLPVSDGNILADDVESFSMAYIDKAGNLDGLSSWSSSGGWDDGSLLDLNAIRVDLTLSHDTGAMSFTSLIYPRFRTLNPAVPPDWNEN